MVDPSREVLRCRKQERALDLHRSRQLDGEGIYSYELRWSDPKFAGCRAFLVGHWESLYELIVQRSPDQRRYHELIREGAPCKLYFDLEFSKLLNPDLDGDALTVKLIEYVCAQLMDITRVETTYEDVLVLKSSTSEKYSTHLIFNIESVCFLDNLVCKSFVDYIMALEASRDFLVNADDEKKVLFCDMAVYSKNRNFRLYMNTKHKKNTFLKVGEIDRYVKSRGLSDDKDIFYHSLVCINKTAGMRIVSDKDIPTIPNVHRETQLQNCDNICGSLRRLSISPRITRKDRKMTFRVPTPFRELDELISNVVASHGGQVYEVKRFIYSKVLLYNFIGYNFCENRGRNHRSNKVYFHVDLTVPGFVQKCFDFQDCHGYASAIKPIPTSVAEKSLQVLKEIDHDYEIAHEALSKNPSSESSPATKPAVLNTK